MPFVKTVLLTAKVTTACYRILATLILGYYLVKETVLKERGQEYVRPANSYPRDPFDLRRKGRSDV